MAMVDAATLALAQRVWDYHTLHHDTAGQRADIILALGSHDLRVAERAAELFHQGCAPLVVMSGGLGHLTQGVFERPEAELFRDAAVAAGVQPEAVLVEPDSSNTGENIVFTRRLLEQRGIPCRSLFLVQKPYMVWVGRGCGHEFLITTGFEGGASSSAAHAHWERPSPCCRQERRSLATLRKRWPEVEVVAVASPQLGLTEYPTKDIPLREVCRRARPARAVFCKSSWCQAPIASSRLG